MNKEDTEEAQEIKRQQIESLAEKIRKEVGDDYRRSVLGEWWLSMKQRQERLARNTAVWTKLLDYCTESALDARDDGDDEQARAWACLASAAGAQAGQVVGVNFKPTEARCSFEIAQGAKDKGPRLASLKVYFPFGVTGIDLAAYAEDIIVEIDAMLNTRKEPGQGG